MAKCTKCQTTFSLDESLNDMEGDSRSSLDFSKHLNVFKLIRNNNEIILERRLREPHTVFLFFFRIPFTIGLILFWYGYNYIQTDIEIYFAVNFGFGFAVFIMLITFYYSIVCMVNIKRITVSKHALKVLSSPIPWFGNEEIAVSDIKQLYVFEEIRGQQNRSYGYIAYVLRVLLHDNESIDISNELPDPNELRLVKKIIDDFLGIKYIPVKGAMFD